MPPRHVVSAGVAIAAAALVAAAVTVRSNSGPTEAGFWFEPVEFTRAVLGQALTPDDYRVIRSVALDELREAFRPFAVTITDRRDSRYSIRVVQTLRGRDDMSFAGASHAAAGFGGQGVVNFEMMIANAIAYAPRSASRDQIVEA